MSDLSGGGGGGDGAMHFECVNERARDWKIGLLAGYAEPVPSMHCMNHRRKYCRSIEIQGANLSLPEFLMSLSSPGPLFVYAELELNLEI